MNIMIIRIKMPTT